MASEQARRKAVKEGFLRAFTRSWRGRLVANAKRKARVKRTAACQWQFGPVPMCTRSQGIGTVFPGSPHSKGQL